MPSGVGEWLLRAAHRPLWPELACLVAVVGEVEEDMQDHVEDVEQRVPQYPALPGLGYGPLVVGLGKSV